MPKCIRIPVHQVISSARFLGFLIPSPLFFGPILSTKIMQPPLLGQNLGTLLPLSADVICEWHRPINVSHFYLRRSTQVYKWHILFFFSLKTSQTSQLNTSNTKTFHSRDVWNENLELLSLSAVCLPTADCLLFKKAT